VVDIDRAQEFGSGTFCEFEIVRIVNNASGVGVFVIDPAAPTAGSLSIILLRGQQVELR
jgi:hypothetical protein